MTTMATIDRLVHHAIILDFDGSSLRNDKTYLRALESILKEAAVGVLLFTSDDPSDKTLQGGTLPHIVKTVNFGSRAAAAFESLRRHQPKGPLMCMEFWVGWFEHWGGPRQLQEPEDGATALDEVLTLGGSVNIYMMHGGTKRPADPIPRERVSRPPARRAVSQSQSQLDILVENPGRTNHGGEGAERKGILAGVRFAAQLLAGKFIPWR